MAADGEASRARAGRNADKVEELTGNFLEQLEEMKSEQRRPKKPNFIEETVVEPECAAYTLDDPDDPEDPDDTVEPFDVGGRGRRASTSPCLLRTR